MSEEYGFRNKYETQDLMRQMEQQQKAAMMNSQVLGGDAQLRESEISASMKLARVSLDSLAESLHMLGTKLQPVTRQQEVANIKDPIKQQPPQTPLGTAIYELVEIIQSMNTRVLQQIDMTEL